MYIPTETESRILRYLSKSKDSKASEDSIYRHLSESRIPKDTAKKAIEGCLTKGFIEESVAMETTENNIENKDSQEKTQLTYRITQTGKNAV